MSDLSDMLLRIMDNAPSPIKFDLEKPPDWVKGVLILWGDDPLFATFDELTIEVTCQEALTLVKLARHDDSMRYNPEGGLWNYASLPQEGSVP